MEENKFKILIAEDDEDDVVLIMEMLREAFGSSADVIDHAESYEVAVSFLLQHRYDICLFDYRLGELSGIELLREVRENGNVTPVIFLTGQGDQEVAVEAMKSGATDYLGKTNLTQEILGQSIRHAMALFTKEEERREAQEKLRQVTLQKDMILNSTGEGIFGMDSDGCITFVNQAASLMLGHKSEGLVDRNAHDLIHHSKIDGSSLSEEQCPHYATLANGIPRHTKDDVFWRKDGSSFPVEYMSTPIIDEEETVGVVVTFQDVTERKRSEEMIKNMAYHDDLTGLPNRVLLYDRISLALNHARRYKEMLAVLFVDLDDFKLVNDTLGHSSGDSMLKEVAQRLKSCLRQGDTVARLGGDEFVILLTQISDAKSVFLIAQKVLDSIEPVFVLGTRNVTLSISVGMALYPQDGETRDTLLKNADLALYRAKEKGKNCLELYGSV